MVAFVVTPPIAVAFRVDVGIGFLLGGTIGICLVITTFVLASVGV